LQKDKPRIRQIFCSLSSHSHSDYAPYTYSDSCSVAFSFKTIYHQTAARVNNLASGLVHLGVTPGDKVALYSVNRAEWIIAEQACYAQNLVTVPLYDTLGMC
jgi:long-subunit acyl-CoA synthetase (AMP-forming)